MGFDNRFISLSPFSAPFALFLFVLAMFSRFPICSPVGLPEAVQLLPVRDPVPCLPSGRAVGSRPVPSEGLPTVPLPPFFGFWCVYGVPIMRTDIIKAVPLALICTGATLPDPVGLSLPVSPYGSRIASAVAACLFRWVCIDVMRGFGRSISRICAIMSLYFSLISL